MLIGLLITALALRLAAAVVLPASFHYRADAPEYVSVAENLLNQGVYGEHEGVPYAVVPPGYPLFMAAVLSVAGRSFLALRLAQAVLGVTAVWFTYLGGRDAVSTRVGLGAALICTIYPPFVVYVVPYLTEALYIPLFALYLAFLVRSLKEPSVKHSALAGLGFGLALLTRETLIAFPLALPVGFWQARFSLRQALRYGLVFALVTVLVLSPWLARNYVAFGHVFYTSRTAYIQYQLTGTGYLSPEYKKAVEEQESPVSKSDRYYDWYRRYGRSSDLWSIRFALDQPRIYLRFLFRRLVEFWLHPNGLWSLPEVFILRAGYIAAHLGMLGLAIWQMIADLRKRDGVTGGLVMMLIYVTAVGVLLRRPNPRYNLPFLPILFIFAARGALALIDRFASRNPVRVPTTRP